MKRALKRRIKKKLKLKKNNIIYMNYIKITKNYTLYMHFFYTYYYCFFYTLSPLQLASFNKTTLLNKIFYIIYFKKLNSTVKKKKRYFSFFRTIKPITLSTSLIKTSKLWYNLRRRNTYRNKLFTKRPFNKKKLYKKLLGIRYNFRRYIIHKKYNTKLTRYIVKFKHIGVNTWFLYFNNNIKVILKKTALLHTNDDFLYLKNKGYIFFNRNNNIKNFTILNKGDAIEIFISIHLLKYNKKVHRLLHKNALRYRFQIRKKKFGKKFKLRREERILKKTERFNTDYYLRIIKNFEISYFTLTILNLKNTYKLINDNFSYTRIYSLYIIRLYNWGWYV